MKSPSAAAVVAFTWILAAAALPASAVDTTGWCEAPGGTPILLCDDFDDYCPDPPCNDGIGSDAPYQHLFLDAWASDGCQEEDHDPSVAVVTDDGRGSSAPFALKQKKSDVYPDAKSYIFDGTSHKRDLKPRIQELDPGMGAVDGSDDSALVLVFSLDLSKPGGGGYEAAQANRYVEITDGSDRAGSDVFIVTCADGKMRPRVALEDDLNHSAVAIGVFALVDEDGPCTPEAKPLTYQPAIYNGDKWTLLKANRLGPGNPPIDITLSKRHNTFILTIRSTTIDMQVTNQNGTFTATAPRAYTGPFSAAHVGNGACVPSPVADYADSIALYGGFLTAAVPTGACCLPDMSCVAEATAAGCTNRLDGFYTGNGTTCETVNCPTPPGACCLPNGTCAFIPEGDCTSQNGRFHGVGVLCDGILCCPLPFADADTDGDVDQQDFGQLQVCVTGLGGGVPVGCECWNRDADDDVDPDDFAQFLKCVTGPSIPFDPGNPPAGCVP